MAFDPEAEEPAQLGKNGLHDAIGVFSWWRPQCLFEQRSRCLMAKSYRGSPIMQGKTC